jgi:predicted outer membrane protein
MIRRLTSNGLLLGLVLLSFAACGDDDDDDTAATGGAAARGGGANAGAANGGAQSGGAKASGGTGAIAGSANTGGVSAGGKSNSGGSAPVAGAGASAGGAEGGSGAEGGRAIGGGGAGGAAEGGTGAVGGAEAGAAGDGGAGGAGPAANLSDGQIFLVIDTLNGGEVEVAFAALPRLDNAAVEAFAQEMVTAHGAARVANSQLAQSEGTTPAPSQVQLDLKAAADAQVLAFQTSPATSLDIPYIDSQVAMHTDALALANQLHAAADDPQLGAELAGLIPDIAAHLTEARALQATLE